jgi:hypothetical protein
VRYASHSIGRKYFFAELQALQAGTVARIDHLHEQHAMVHGHSRAGVDGRRPHRPSGGAAATMRPGWRPRLLRRMSRR